MTAAQSERLKKAFLADFRKHGNITRACRTSGVGRTTVYRWQEHDEPFAQEYRQAEIEATEHLEEAAYERAVNGVTKETPILHRGKVVDTVIETKFSDTLLIFLLKARAPEKYRERVQLQHADSEGKRLPIAAVEEYVRSALGG